MSDKLPPKILVAEKDEVINTNLANTIERYWFDVTRVKTANEALRISAIKPPHVAIISSEIVDLSAIELAKKIRAQEEMTSLPIIFLINKEEDELVYTKPEDDFIEVLKKPYSPDDLMKTIRTLLRKSKPVFQDKIIKRAGISMDLSTYKVYRENNQIHLGPTEFKILQLFIQRPNYVFSRRQIIDYVWGTDKDIAPRTIDVHINRIRTLMKIDSDENQLIKTFRSEGYSLI